MGQESQPQSEERHFQCGWFTATATANGYIHLYSNGGDIQMDWEAFTELNEWLTGGCHNTYHTPEGYDCCN